MRRTVTGLVTAHQRDATKWRGCGAECGRYTTETRFDEIMQIHRDQRAVGL